MKTLYFAPAVCTLHEANDGHPECPERLLAIENAVQEAELPSLIRSEAFLAYERDLLLAHSRAHIDNVFANVPGGNAIYFLDPDTVLCNHSGQAALYAAGSVLQAVEQVMTRKGANAFCAIRPPGHHAHRDQAAGFCLFNNVAIGALAALQRYDLKRVAILDFDVHHGNGTEDIVKNNPAIFFASTYEYPQYASTEKTRYETGIENNVLNIPLPSETRGKEFLAVWRNNILPKVKDFKAEMIFVSAGFDGHRNDPLGGWKLKDQDYADLMQGIKELADEICDGRLVVVLEGGYNLEALSSSVLACLKVMGS